MTHRPPSALRVAREWRGLTIRQLRDASGISTGRLSMMERGMVQPNDSERERLAAALQQTVEAIFPSSCPWPREAALEPARSPVPALAEA